MKPKTIDQLRALQARRGTDINSADFAGGVDRQGNAFAPQSAERYARFLGREVNDRDYPELAPAQQKQYRELGIQRQAQTQIERLRQLMQEINAQYPQYTHGVKMNYLADNDPMWTELAGGDPKNARVMARGTANAKSKPGAREVWYNANQFAGVDDATAKFVLMKELGQAAERMYVDSPEKAAAYHQALGYHGPTPDERLGTQWSYLGSQGTVTRPNGNQAGYPTSATTPQDWYGRDFAQSLGYAPTGENVQFSPDVMRRLQALQVLPRRRGRTPMRTRGTF